MKPLIDRIVQKLTSGQFLLTIIAGLVFGQMAVAGTISPDASLGLITMVFTLYFKRDRETEAKP
jgi:hypothetical protein